MRLTDKETFCEQIRKHEKAMYGLAFSVVKNEADASEAISEAILKAYKNISSLKNETAFKAWILRIVHNTSVELVRKNARIISLDEIELAENSAEENIVNNLTLKEAVERLEQPFRTAVILYYYENLSISQISDITGATAVAVKQRLSRARKQLRKLLKEDFISE